MTIGRPKVGPYLFDHNVVVFKCESGAGQAIIKDYSSDPGAKPQIKINLCHGMGAFMPPPPLGEDALLRWWAKMQEIQDLKGNFLK